MVIFSDATSDFQNSKFVILGIPFDGTSAYRPGARFAPNSIREASYNFESYLFEHDVNLQNIPIHDYGNLEEFGDVKQMVNSVEKKFEDFGEKMPIVMGGEHSITYPIIKSIAKKIDIEVVFMDAHLDFRNEYLGLKESHACTVRRVSEVVGLDNIVLIGIRSMSNDEKNDAIAFGLKYITADEVKKNGMEEILNRVLKQNKKKLYLSLDIDCIDPSYAPGTGTPEPFGITPDDVKKAINLLGKKLVGFDIVEICPPYDNGNTSILGARLIREVIGV
ncbi:MAG: agmatinase, partial [Candidatus Thermoplasmatota archaeon]